MYASTLFGWDYVRRRLFAHYMYTRRRLARGVCNIKTTQTCNLLDPKIAARCCCSLCLLLNRRHAFLTSGDGDGIPVDCLARVEILSVGFRYYGGVQYSINKSIVVRSGWCKSFDFSTDWYQLSVTYTSCVRTGLKQSRVLAVNYVPMKDFRSKRAGQMLPGSARRIVCVTPGDVCSWTSINARYYGKVSESVSTEHVICIQRNCSLNIYI